GVQVELVTKDGSKYIGVLQGANLRGPLGIVLKHVRPQPRQDQAPTNTIPPPINTLIIAAGDLVSISAVVDFTAATKKTEARRLGFQTDTDISGGGILRERELRPWVPDADDADIETLESHSLSGEGRWNQFKVNEELFGVKSDFDEELYTTKLNRDRPDFRERELEAIRIANEIQASPAPNIHIAEERREISGPADDGMDEEARYGAVLRSAQKSGKYVPPFIRTKAGASLSPLVATSPATRSTPSDVGALEVSSAIEEPADTGMPAQTGSIIPTLQVSVGPVASNAAAAAALSKLNIRTLPSTDSVDKPQPPAEAAAPKEETATMASPIAGHRSLAPLASRVEKSRGDGRVPPKPKIDIATRIITEREKLQMKKKAMIQDKMAELVEFGSKFKLKTPMPEDVAEIIRPKKAALSGNTEDDAEDNGSAEERPEGGDTVAIDTAKDVTQKTSAEANAADTAPKGAKEPASKPTKPTTEFKLNANAPSFRPNPKAPAFVPKVARAAASGRTHSAARPEYNPFFGSRKVDKQPVKLWGDVLAIPARSSDSSSSKASETAPTWTYGNRSFRTHFMPQGRDISGATMDGSGAGYYMSIPQPYPHPQYGYVPGHHLPSMPAPPPPFMSPAPMYQPSNTSAPWRVASSNGSYDPHLPPQYTHEYSSPVLTASAGPGGPIVDYSVPHQHPAMVMVSPQTFMQAHHIGGASAGMPMMQPQMGAMPVEGARPAQLGQGNGNNGIDAADNNNNHGSNNNNNGSNNNNNGSSSGSGNGSNSGGGDNNSNAVALGNGSIP
ncbi:poly(A)-binding protein binding protein, partial [Spiromyces aspiralis]